MANRGGRPTKLNDELRTKICTLIKGGALPKDAPAMCGIGETTYYKWMQWGNRKEERFREFREFRKAVLLAVGEAKSKAAIRVYRDDPKWWLSRGPGKRDWSEKTEVCITGDEDHPIQIEDRRPAPIQTLALGYAILQDLGVLPSATEGGNELLANFSEVEEGEMPEDGVGNAGILTAAPEWMRRTPGQGRKRGGGGKKGKGKKDKGSEGGSPPAAP